MRKERIIDLPKIIDRRGNLSFIEGRNHIPFDIARTYWVYNIPGGQKRGSHAFKTQQELIVALSGSFDVVLDDGKEKRSYTLNRSYQGLYVPNGLWRSLENFSTNSVYLVISSGSYDEADYIRNYREFKQYTSSPIIAENLIDIKPFVADEEYYHTVFDCSLIELPVIKNKAGDITPVHNSENIPFDIKRAFYIYDIPSGEKRGMHAHKQCHEVLVAVSGSFDVELDDGVNKKTVTLNHPMYGLHIPPGVWATEKNYSAGVVCLALASEKYECDDYIKTYSAFKKYRLNGSKSI